MGTCPEGLSRSYGLQQTLAKTWADTNWRLGVLIWKYAC